MKTLLGAAEIRELAKELDLKPTLQLKLITALLINLQLLLKNMVLIPKN